MCGGRAKQVGVVTLKNVDGRIPYLIGAVGERIPKLESREHLLNFQNVHFVFQYHVIDSS
jgi:hypothetical protein